MFISWRTASCVCFVVVVVVVVVVVDVVVVVVVVVAGLSDATKMFFSYDDFKIIRTILGRNPDTSRNPYNNKVRMIILLYFYRAQPCTSITVLSF